MKWSLDFCATVLLAAFVNLAGSSVQEDDVADIPSQDLRAGKDARKRYFLVGPMKHRKPPNPGFRLLVVLPGGPGSADFHPFVKRIYKYAVPEGYLVAQPVAPDWIVWPTRKDLFSAETFIDAVIEDVSKRHKLDTEFVFTLSWSSSGPAAYAISLSSKKVTGSFIAMSVFKPDQLPPLETAKEHGYFLFHSPDDQVCPFAMAERAARDLKEHGAKVNLTTYRGKHGWQAGLYQSMRAGIGWLEENHSPLKR
ncbi:MAG TPA: hypothetical protein VH592_07405 [Gemmataceae bacterium]|jgi:predicted esterase